MDDKDRQFMTAKVEARIAELDAAVAARVFATPEQYNAWIRGEGMTLRIRELELRWVLREVLGKHA